MKNVKVKDGFLEPVQINPDIQKLYLSEPGQRAFEAPREFTVGKGTSFPKLENITDANCKAYIQHMVAVERVKIMAYIAQ